MNKLPFKWRNGLALLLFFIPFLVFILIFSQTNIVIATETTHSTSHDTGTHKVEKGHEEAGSHETGKNLTKDLILRIWNFAVLLGGLIYLMRKPLKEMVGGRRKAIEEELKDLERRKEEARMAYLEYEKKLSDIKREKEKIIQQYIEEGEKEKERIIKEAQEISERMKEQARITIEQEIAKAKEELRAEMAELSAKSAEEIIKKNITPDDQINLIKEYLTQVAEVQN